MEFVLSGNFIIALYILLLSLLLVFYYTSILKSQLNPSLPWNLQVSKLFYFCLISVISDPDLQYDCQLQFEWQLSDCPVTFREWLRFSFVLCQCHMMLKYYQRGIYIMLEPQYENFFIAGKRWHTSKWFFPNPNYSKGDLN